MDDLVSGGFHRLWLQFAAPAFLFLFFPYEFRAVTCYEKLCTGQAKLSIVNSRAVVVFVVLKRALRCVAVLELEMLE